VLFSVGDMGWETNKRNSFPGSGKEHWFFVLPGFSGLGWKLTIHPHLFGILKTRKAVPTLLPFSVMACIEVT
jgi:hypothetical protein